MTEKTKIEKLHQDLHDWMEAPTLESSTTIAHQLVRDNYTTLRELVGNAMQTIRATLSTPPVDGATEEARYAREKLKQNIEYAEALDHYYVVLDIDFAKRLLLHTLDSAAKEG